MEENYDFSKVGKRMPYSVPDGFFTELEDSVMRELETKPTAKTVRKRTFMRVVATVLTTAAVIVMAFILTHRQPVGYAEVEQAFNSLSAEDQMYMLSVYQDDIFINEELK